MRETKRQELHANAVLITKQKCSIKQEIKETNKHPKTRKGNDEKRNSNRGGKTNYDRRAFKA